MGHAYDDPNITPLQFLKAVMNDPDVPVSLRVKAASKLLPFTESIPSPVREPVLTIQINGDMTVDVERKHPSLAPVDISYPSCPYVPVPEYMSKRDTAWRERCKRYGLDPSLYH